MKRRVVALVLTVLLLCLTACGAKKPTNTNTNNSSQVAANSQTTVAFGSQTDLPEIGEEVAVLHTSMGDIYMRLFPQFAPKAVENFTTHIRNGYYDGIIFHRVDKDFVIQGGDPTGTGYYGESIWGADFEDEFTPQLHNLRGALSMANSGTNTNASQFFIVQAASVASTLLDQMKAYPDSYPEQCRQQYASMGGTPWLDFRHTVFGHVYKGMDVVDAIAAVAVDANDKPTTDVVITKAEMITYQG